MSQPGTIRIGSVEIELRHRGERFLGLGRIRIGGQDVRGGELALAPFTATHDGVQFQHFILEQIEERSADEVVLRTRAIGTDTNVWALQDHSLDPVWSTRPWDERTLAEARVEWHLRADSRTVGGRTWIGFTYSYRFSSEQAEVYYILDRATWELGGEAEGVTLLRQQMGEDPMVTIGPETEYSTSAHIPFPLNPVMTHDVPRWASEQGFDYQYRGGTALLGLFEQCGLIRTIVVRNAGDSHIRHFDKHIFDQAADVRTVPKFIGLGSDIGDETAHLNQWTAAFDADQDNVLSEFGMARTYPRTTLSMNFWTDFTWQSYLEDLIPAAAALGFQQVFIDPFWENDMTRKREGALPDYMVGNMCCPHEYEVAKVLGGIEGYRRLADHARTHGIEIISWIGSHQSQISPYLSKQPAEVIKQADGRHYYGSGYDVIYGMDLNTPFGEMFEKNAIQAARATGISGYLYDSFYNFGWMPVNFHTPDPAEPENAHKGTLRAHTQWRRCAEIMAAWQKAGLHMLIESLGPWGQPQHGAQGDYRLANGALAYQCAVKIGYSVIPTPETSGRSDSPGPAFYFQLLAHKSASTQPLWLTDREGQQVRIDRAADPLLRQANLAYRAVLPRMHTRTVLPGHEAVLWQDRQGKPGALFSFAAGHVALPAGTRCMDHTTDIASALGADGLSFEPWHVYEFETSHEEPR